MTMQSRADEALGPRLLLPERPPRAGFPAMKGWRPDPVGPLRTRGPRHSTHGAFRRWLFLQEVSSQRDVVFRGIPRLPRIRPKKNSQAPAVLPPSPAVSGKRIVPWVRRDDICMSATISQKAYIVN